MLTALLLLACSEAAPPVSPAPAGTASSAPAPAGSSRKVEVVTLKADLEAKAVPVLVDVRTPGEYAGGHVAGAVNIPIDRLGARLGELESYRGREVYLICEVGGRSASAARTMEAAGWKVVDVAGGTSAWRSAGYPVE